MSHPVRTKILVLSLLLVSCARVAGERSTLPEEVRCELVSLDLADEAATASFRVSNTSGRALSYQGYSGGMPLYHGEVLDGGSWQPAPLGWCGTGLEAQVLEPGESMEFEVAVARDGRSYRFSFGDPPVRTPPVSAAPR